MSTAPFGSVLSLTSSPATFSRPIGSPFLTLKKPPLTAAMAPCRAAMSPTRSACITSSFDSTLDESHLGRIELQQVRGDRPRRIDERLVGGPEQLDARGDDLRGAKPDCGVLTHAAASANAAASTKRRRTIRM